MGVGRSTLSKWVRLYREQGEAGLQSKPVRWNRQRPKVASAVKTKVVELKRHRPDLGIKKISQFPRRVRGERGRAPNHERSRIAIHFIVVFYGPFRTVRISSFTSLFVPKADPMKLKDRVVLVTGASLGLGAEITREAAREGADVIINYNSHRAAAEAVLLEVQRLGRRGMVFQADVGVKAEADALVAAGLEAFGKIDVLINNAGIALWKPFLELDESNWDRTLQTNLKSVFLCSQAVARHLVGRKSPGSIVNISSGAAAGALDCLVPYCASKGGMLLITRAMATELAPYNIRVNSLAPGTIDIARNRQLDPKFPDNWLNFIPMGRVGVPSDVAKPVIFLASDEAAYVTGQTFWADGGLTSYVPMPRADFAR
jgi:glucose 1-dehydrogenase